MNKKLEKMAEDRYHGATLEEAISKTLGKNVASRSKEIQKMVRDIFMKASSLEEKYTVMNIRMAAFQEIDEQCGDSIADSFRMTSDWKYVIALRNLELSEDEMKEQGMDSSFVRDMLTKTHAAEQEMAANATMEELDALRAELSSILPDDTDSLKASLRQVAADESWDPVLDKAEEVAGGITEQAREDAAVLTAALFLSQHPEKSLDEVAAAAAIQTAQSEAPRKAQFVRMAIPAALQLAVAGFFVTFLGAIAGVEAVAGFGVLLAIASASVFCLLAFIAAGQEAYRAVKQMVPFIKSAWQKCRPYAKKAASKVKRLIAGIIGVVNNHVFRPAIHWVANTAIPVIREKVFHPLKRRLAAMLEWLSDKKRQVMAFIRDAAAPADVEQEYADDSGFVYTDEDEDENEFEFA